MLNGVSWRTSIGGIICLAGGAFLLWKMIDGSDPIDTMHIALLAFCLGGTVNGFAGKDSNVTTLGNGVNQTVKKQ